MTNTSIKRPQPKHEVKDGRVWVWRDGVWQSRGARRDVVTYTASS